LTALTLNIDGASKGNPGHASIGICISSNGEIIKKYSAYIGQATNNAAEYQALLKGLELAAELGATSVDVMSDSELVVRQMNGTYQVKNETLFPLYEEAQKRAKTFFNFAICHVPRSKNKEADRLANQGIKEGLNASSQA
jgi:ribonuclease HI